MTTEAQKAATRRYYNANVTKITVELYPADADIKAVIEEAVAKGESRNAFIKRAIREYSNRS